MESQYATPGIAGLYNRKFVERAIQLDLIFFQGTNPKPEPQTPKCAEHNLPGVSQLCIENGTVPA